MEFDPQDDIPPLEEIFRAGVAAGWELPVPNGEAIALEPILAVPWSPPDQWFPLQLTPHSDDDSRNYYDSDANTVHASESETESVLPSAGKRSRNNGEEDQPRKTPVKASIFTEAIRLVFSNGFLELLAGPWSYGQCVKLTAACKERVGFDGRPVEAKERHHLHGRTLCPDDGILADWVGSNRSDRWEGHGWNPGNALAVRWSDGTIDFHRVDFQRFQVDLQIVVPTPGLQASVADTSEMRELKRTILDSSRIHPVSAHSEAEVAQMAEAANGRLGEEALLTLAANPRQGRAEWVGRCKTYAELCEKELAICMRSSNTVFSLSQHIQQERQLRFPETDRKRQRAALNVHRAAMRRRVSAFLCSEYDAFDHAFEAAIQWWQLKQFFGL